MSLDIRCETEAIIQPGCAEIRRRMSLSGNELIFGDS